MGKTERIKAFIEPYLSTFGTRGTHTVAVLEEVPWKDRQWWPRILYFPDGLHAEEENVERSIAQDRFFYVYYRTFHCFDCHLDIDAFSFDRDAYVLRTAELEAAYQMLKLKNECPRCHGNMRNPGLIQIIEPLRKN